MSIFKPFKAVRPMPAYAEKVAALPYDVMNSDEAREKVQGNPYSFLHVDKAEIDLPIGTGLYDDIVYQTAANNLKSLERDQICKQDKTPCFYIYMQTWNGHTQTGIVGCASIDDYINGNIKKHELTRADKEADRIRHVDECDANTGPIFLTYKGSHALTALINDFTATHLPIYDFKSEGEVANKIWVVNEENVNAEIESLFSDVDALYIADGHHRCASAAKVGMMRRVFVVLDQYIDEDDNEVDEIIELVNPEIVERQGEVTIFEGCLSFPGRNGAITRPQYVVAKAQDRDGNMFVIEAEDILARAICHECDHLDGITIMDHATKFYEDMTPEEIKALNLDEDYEE